MSEQSTGLKPHEANLPKQEKDAETSPKPETQSTLGRKFDALTTHFHDFRTSIQTAFDRIKGSGKVSHESREIQKWGAEMDLTTAQTAEMLDIPHDRLPYITIKKIDEPNEDDEFNIDPPKRDIDSLALIAEKGEADNDFINVTDGESNYSSLPGYLNQPDLLTAHMLDMRDYSQSKDNELRSGVYVYNQTGDLGVLSYPVTGYVDHIGGSYKSGALAKVDGADIKVDIHSHPSHEREKDKLGDNVEDILLGDNLQSNFDLATVIVKLHHRSQDAYDNANSAIVIGNDLAVMLCRTKQTPLQNQIEKDIRPGYGFHKVMDKIHKIIADIKAKNPNISPFNLAMIRTAKFCEEYQVGMYMMRLRDHARTPNTWTRIMPLPENMDEAIRNMNLMSEGDVSKNPGADVTGMEKATEVVGKPGTEQTSDLQKVVQEADLSVQANTTSQEGNGQNSNESGEVNSEQLLLDEIHRLKAHPMLAPFAEKVPAGILDKIVFPQGSGTNARFVKDQLSFIVEQFTANPGLLEQYKTIFLDGNREALTRKTQRQIEQLRGLYFGKDQNLSLTEGERNQKKLKLEAFRKFVNGQKPVRYDANKTIQEFRSPRSLGRSESFGVSDVIIQGDDYVYGTFDKMHHHMGRGYNYEFDDQDIADRSEIVMQDVAKLSVSIPREDQLQAYVNNVFDYQSGKEVMALYLASVFETPEEVERYMESNTSPRASESWLAEAPFLGQTYEDYSNQDLNKRSSEVFEKIKEMYKVTGIVPPTAPEVRIRDHAKARLIHRES